MALTGVSWSGNDDSILGRNGVKPVASFGFDTIVGVLKFLAYTRDGPALAGFGFMNEGTSGAPCLPMTVVAFLNLP